MKKSYTGKYNFELEDGVYSAELVEAAENLVFPTQYRGKRVASVWADEYGPANRAIVKTVEIPLGIKDIYGPLFECFSSLETVSISASVEYIGSDVFGACPAIREIKVDPDNEEYISVSGNLYDKDMKTLIKLASASVGECFAIPSGVEKIEDRAIENCENLVKLHIPASLKEMEYLSIDKCTALKEISVDCDNEEYCSLYGCLYSKDLKILIKATPGSPCESYNIPEGVEEIGSWAFDGCRNLTELSLPEGLVTIACNAFGSCSSLKKISLPKSLETIELYAFENCTSLEEIVIPRSVNEIDMHAFDGCDKLTVLCEANEPGEDWHALWNCTSRPVKWGYKG